MADGQPVEVRTDRGTLTGIAKLDPAIRRGVVSIPHGHRDANVNALTDKDVLDPVTGMVRYSAVPVSLGPAHRVLSLGQNAGEVVSPGWLEGERPTSS